MNNKQSHFEKGFTLVELVVSLAIFAFMTIFLIAKYGTFNQSVLLTNLAYDVALNIRTAQSYGLNVKSVPSSTGAPASDVFKYPYGVHFDKNVSGSPPPPPPQNNKFVFFADTGPVTDYMYTDMDTTIATYNIKRGGVVVNLCSGSGPGEQCQTRNTLDITFKRPDPNAIIKADYSPTSYPYAEITLKATDGGTKRVIVRSTGQIQISN